MNIYIGTCNAYSNILIGSCYLMNKFWKNRGKTTILYYDEIPDLPDGFESISLGNEKTLQQDKRIWTDGMKKFFEKIDDEYFIFSLDDYWMLEPFDDELFSHVMKYVDEGVAKIDLSNTVTIKPEKKEIGSFNETKIYEAGGTAPYRASMQASVWRRDYFLKFLQPGWTSTDFEIKGQSLAINDGERIIGCSDMICNYTEIYGAGRVREHVLPNLREYGIYDELRKKEMIE